jgi:hypothetical protein
VAKAMGKNVFLGNYKPLAQGDPASATVRHAAGVAEPVGRQYPRRAFDAGQSRARGRGRAAPRARSRPAARGRRPVRRPSRRRSPGGGWSAASRAAARFGRPRGRASHPLRRPRREFDEP